MKAATFIAIGLSFGGCDATINAVIDGISEMGQRPAVATTTGFYLDETFPSRNTQHDHLKPSQGISQAQLSKLVHHIDMPQSHGAMVSLLGYPDYEDGDYLYWAIAGGSSELAVEYNGSIAWRFTVGY
ncbi:MAG: hypothetical protein AB8B99_02965 [Phormidesmis sp.]